MSRAFAQRWSIYAYYVEPGHSPVMEAGTEIVEFSPKDEYRKTMEVAERNLAAMQEGR
jgi:hypothetical protein